MPPNYKTCLVIKLETHFFSFPISQDTDCILLRLERKLGLKEFGLKVLIGRNDKPGYSVTNGLFESVIESPVEELLDLY